MNSRLIPTIIASALFTAVPSSRAQMPELLPQYWQENLTAEDGTLNRCLVFRTVPGVVYTVEWSHDLSTWSADNTLYGLGHDFATPMCRTTAETVPQGGGGPPPNPLPIARLVALRLEPANDSAGGTVVSWPSLETGGALIHRIPEAMSEDWQGIPLYSQRFGEWYFFVGHPTGTAAPPAENPVLAGADAAMIASLRVSFPAMNQEVETSVILARNTPPPAPPDPDAKKFWRIKADWSKDSDGDGTPDLA
jgi:hypothetical protein